MTPQRADAPTASDPAVDGRVFLGWDRPALRAAAERLVAHYRTPLGVRMDGALVVLPGSRPGRRLAELLVELCEADGLLLVPPRVVKIGDLPELLYRQDATLATPLAARLAWAEVLREAGAEAVREVFPTPPAPDDMPGWMGLAGVMGRLHTAVGGAGHRLRDVAGHCGPALGWDDARRWRVLGALGDAYHARLEALGLADREESRLRALETRAAAAEPEIWLLGVAEMPAVTRSLLAAVGTRVRVLIHAPEALAARFDALGCVEPSAWHGVEIALDASRVRLADAPAHQALEALSIVDACAARFGAEEIAIGVPDESVTPHLEQRLEAAGVPTRSAAGTPLRQTAPYRLLEAVAGFLDGRRWESLAALLRHPELADWLDARGAPAGWPGCADRYHQAALPGRVGGKLSGRPGEAAREKEALDALLERIDRELLDGLDGQDTLAAWAPRMLELVARVYGGRELDRTDPAERRLVGACERLRDAAAALHALPDGLAGRCDAADAIRVLLEEATRKPVPPDADGAAVELLGWLELHLDDAPALVITGFNEPPVPASTPGDPFLPDALCARLGIADDAHRYARDAYLLDAILRSRAETWLVAGRRGSRGDPLRPSRLLFAAPPPEVARRIRRWFGAAEPAWSAPPASAGARASRFRLPPEPRISAPRVIDSLSVTDFRTLLADPYLFALQRVLGLEACGDAEREMGPLVFGSLAHGVLQAFGEDAALRECAEEATIRAALDRLLDTRSRERFGAAARPAVRVQLEQLRARLHAFSRWQAGWVADGWRTVAVEQGKAGATLVVDDTPFTLRGRIDRIDRNERTGEWAVLDYKTSERGDPPGTTHRRRDGTWVDLQLPLYRHLLAAMRTPDGAPLVPPAATLRLGYILLPGDPAVVGAALADWSEDDLADADAAAEDVVRLVRENVFELPEGAVPRLYPDDPLRPLLGIGQLAGAGEENGPEAAE